MPRTLVIATRNPGKFREMAALLGDLKLELRSLDNWPEVGEVPETGETFEENARAKALGYALATGEWALADDSGLEVDALGGAPGVRSARWAEDEDAEDDRQARDAANNARLLAELAARPETPWTARYRCVMALATPDRVVSTTEGACEGAITDRPAGTGGFGYDPYFVPEGYDRTMAQLPPDEKNHISHRGEALRKMRERLEKLL